LENGTAAELWIELHEGLVELHNLPIATIHLQALLQEMHRILFEAESFKFLLIL
jgi:hypothetical protein